MSRFLFVLDIGFDRGGPSVHLLQEILRSGLAKGHSIEVVLKNTGGTQPEMPFEFCENPNFKYISIKEEEEKKYGFVGRYLNEVRYARKCSKFFLKQGRYDAVFLESCTTAIFYIHLLKKLKCPIVFNIQDIFPYNLKLSGQLPFKAITFPVFRKLQNMAYQRADSLITISEDMKDTLVQDGVAPQKIAVVYNWSYSNTPINLESIPKDSIFNLQLDSEKINVVYAGNIGKMQNVELIASAAVLSRDDPSVHYYIIGGGTNCDNIKLMVEGLTNVTMLPMQPSKYAESLYAQADINVIPLAPGGVKTALPSKTATVLRVPRPVIFCVDKDSKLSDLLKDDEMAAVVDCVSSEELLKTIHRIGKPQKNSDGNYQVFLNHFQTTNAEKYIEAMECLEQR